MQHPHPKIDTSFIALCALEQFSAISFAQEIPNDLQGMLEYPDLLVTIVPMSNPLCPEDLPTAQQNVFRHRASEFQPRFAHLNMLLPRFARF